MACRWATIYPPRIDLRARKEASYNVNGINARYDDQASEWVHEGDRWKIQREIMLGALQQVRVPNLARQARTAKKADDCKCD
ncbi:MAG: hypothetical protein ACK4SR_11775 [Thiobacillus sp.]